ncbi:MAG: hypothetical protein LAO03_23685 [Acidobacteriia bacterium]|nr:hypothetical protein [Terriglobia bacterium]
MSKNMCTLGIVIMLCWCWSVSAAYNGQPDAGKTSGLILEALLVKPTYAQGETVELTFKLRNAGRNKALIARTFQLTRYIDLEILDQQGKHAQWCGRVISQTDSARSFTTLAPGASVSLKLPISCVNGGDPGRAWGYTLVNRGKYIIRATYRLPQPEKFFERFFPNTPVVRGPIPAEPVTIEIE